jgi:hypothetical protein
VGTVSFIALIIALSVFGGIYNWGRGSGVGY